MIIYKSKQVFSKSGGQYFRCIQLLLLIICFIKASSAATTYCVSQDDSTLAGPRLCNNTDDVQMLGSYVNIGINRYGSFGTHTSYFASYYAGQLGIICNFDKKGFTTDIASYSGDYLTASFAMDSTYFSISIISLYF